MYLLSNRPLSLDHTGQYVTESCVMNDLSSVMDNLTQKLQDVKYLVALVSKGKVTEDEDVSSLCGAHQRFNKYKLKNFQMCFKNLFVSRKEDEVAGAQQSGMISIFYFSTFVIHFVLLLILPTKWFFLVTMMVLFNVACLRTLHLFKTVG